MHDITLSDTVTSIYQIVDRRKKRNLLSPFFFIAGAGLSYPPIPLAATLEEECREIASGYGHTAPPTSSAPIDSYSHWLGKAHPSREELKDYLRGLMEKKTVSKANLRLAHLLLDGRLARTVFTPNFDDMLLRALQHFGQTPLVCDHPMTVSRMRIESTDLQIIHVHGTFWFYDCCNLKEDISQRMQSGSMTAMLEQSLREHSPLVIGYSGWEGDIIMSSLKRRLEAGSLGNPIFWFC